MLEELDPDVAGTEEAAQRRDEIVSQVTDHAGQVARELSFLQGGDYGQATFETDRGAWSLKYEAGDVQYLRYESGRTETYVVSTKKPPEPDALAEAMADYDAFVRAFADHVASFEGILEDVSTQFPEVASTDSVVAERERVLSRIRECANAMAGELHRYHGSEYGTFDARVEGDRWELKWEDGRADYLRVGGEGGIYILSQYQPPSAHDLRAHVDGFRAFVEAFNEQVREVSDELATVSV